MNMGHVHELMYFDKRYVAWAFSFSVVFFHYPIRASNSF